MWFAGKKPSECFETCVCLPNAKSGLDQETKVLY